MQNSDLLGDDSARILMYVWGGNHMRGDILPAPYLNELGRIILRPASTGRRRTGQPKNRFQRALAQTTRLVGIAISADSDDTDTQIRAGVSIGSRT